MEDKQKVYIKGNSNRGAEVIKALEDLGAINLNNLDGKGENTYYYISPLGFIIGVANYEENMMSILKEFYKEIELPRWKPEYGNDYYFISDKGYVTSGIWENAPIDCWRYAFGNCFRTLEDAKIARKKIKEILTKE